MSHEIIKKIHTSRIGGSLSFIEFVNTLSHDDEPHNNIWQLGVPSIMEILFTQKS